MQRKTVRKLLQHFGSVKRIREAPRQALAEVTGPAVAEKIANYFHPEAAPQTESAP